MSKTFKSATDNEGELDVRANDCGVFIAFSRAGQIWQASTFAPSDAPALALAILEAAGADSDLTWSGAKDYGNADHLGWIAGHLDAYIKTQERATAEAKEQAELEVEALDFLNVSRKAKHLGPLGNFDDHTKDAWLAVARRAREMRAEK